MTAKQDEKLELRAAPGRKLVRFKKGVVIGGAAIASAGLLGVTMMALQTPSLRQGLPTGELYNNDRKPTRSDERTVGKECVSLCRSRWSPYHYKLKPIHKNMHSNTKYHTIIL